MRIFITIPTLRTPHGGTRIILTWAEYLSKDYDVILFVQNGGTHCNWFPIPPRVLVTDNYKTMRICDKVIICSPHSVHLQHYLKPNQRCFIFLQMIEHYFRPNDVAFYRQCLQFYTTPHPVIHGSHWNERVLREMGRTGPCHYVGNGIKLDDFPISDKPKDGRYVLIEGWECTNPAKDTDAIAPRVAARLKSEGYKILAYSQLPLRTMPDVPDEYYQLPTLAQMNELYERATILIKASRYDARAVAPLEAMTKGTVTARAIIEGDDDLLHGKNCLRGGYDEDELYHNARLLLQNDDLRTRISKRCLAYVQTFTWDYWMEEIKKII